MHRTHKPANLFLFVVGVGLSAASMYAQSTCNVTASTGSPDATHDPIFVQNGPGTGYEPSGQPGWTGSDGSSSVFLPDHTSAFLFDDSFAGQSPAVTNDGTVSLNGGVRTRATPVFRSHNLIAVLAPATNTLTTTAGPINANGFSTSYFVPSDSSHKYWPNDGMVLTTDSSGTQSVWVSLGEFNGPNYVGGAIAQLQYPGLGIQMIAPFQNTMLTLPSGAAIRWGTSFDLEGTYGAYTLYVYGSSGSRPYIAKVALSGAMTVSDAADMGNWLFYSSAYGWVTLADIQASSSKTPTPIIGATNDPNNAKDTVLQASSVRKVQTLVNGSPQTSYLLLGENTPAGTSYCQAGKPKLVLYSACSPQGPFSAKTVVYSPPEAGASTVTGGQTLAGTLCTYFPNMHPQFNSNGNLVLSYDVNSSNSQDLVYADTYRPRFVTVPIANLQ